MEGEMSQIHISDVSGRNLDEGIFQDQEETNKCKCNDDDRQNRVLVCSTYHSLWCRLWNCCNRPICVYFVTAIASQAAGWTGIDAFLATFQPVPDAAVIPSLLLVPAFTALMVSIHSYASEEKKIWSLLGLAFTLIYATMAATNYLIQLLLCGAASATARRMD